MSDDPEFKSIYDGYESHRMDPADMGLIEKSKRRTAAANKRFEKTGDARHPKAITAEKRKSGRELAAVKQGMWAKNEYYMNNLNMQMNDEGNIINPADFNACNQAGRYGSFTHGNNGCGCQNCD
jgi:hypothetical protein